MRIAGIDWSLTSPCVCVFDDSLKKTFEFKNCNFYVLNDRSKNLGRTNNINIYPHYQYETQDERYHLSMTHFLPVLMSCAKIYIEDYAFAATGRVFNIAESTEVLQYNLWINDLSYKKVAPTAIKKFATGKGNANKDFMYECFSKETNVDLQKELGVKNCNSPISDIVDSYYICKYAFGDQ